jgi:biopolymer transport protein ExbD
MRVKRRRLRPARVEMLPLIDVVFLLLVFFIYAMLSMSLHRGLRLDLPVSSESEAETARVVQLSVTAGKGCRGFSLTGRRWP